MFGTTLFVEVRCSKCDVQFCMTETMQRARQNDGETFYCPNGHPRVYRETEADRLRRERDRLTQRLAQRDDEIQRVRDARDAADRRAAAARGQVTKIKNRVGHGVCPCCNRSFENLARHISSKHPTFTAEAAE